jgi:hypothetical protein
LVAGLSTDSKRQVGEAIYRPDGTGVWPDDQSSMAFRQTKAVNSGFVANRILDKANQSSVIGLYLVALAVFHATS